MGSSDRTDLVRLPDGRRAQLWEGGAADGPVVFFMHGTPDCRLAAATGDAAARRAGLRLVAVNRPGYGDSDPTVSGHLSVADDTAAVADLLEVERFGVLGMSLGGPYAVACAVRHPERVAALAVVSAAGMAPEMDPPLHRDDLTEDKQAFFRGLADRDEEEVAASMRPEFCAYVEQLRLEDEDVTALAERWIDGMHPLDAALLRALPVEDLVAEVRESLAGPEGYLRDVAVTFRPWAFRPEHVRCPTSLWYGALDANAPPRNGRWYAERIRGATLTVRERLSHLGALVEQWDDILAMLARHLPGDVGGRSVGDRL